MDGAAAATRRHGLRDVLQHGAGIPWADVAVLAGWAAAGLGAAARWFRWE